jgi:hypothetical protein
VGAKKSGVLSLVEKAKLLESKSPAPTPLKAALPTSAKGATSKGAVEAGAGAAAAAGGLGLGKVMTIAK